MSRRSLLRFGFRPVLVRGGKRGRQRRPRRIHRHDPVDGGDRGDGAAARIAGQLSDPRHMDPRHILPHVLLHVLQLSEPGLRVLPYVLWGCTSCAIEQNRIRGSWEIW